MIRAAATLIAGLLVTGFLLFGTNRNAAKFESRSTGNALKIISKIGDAKSPMKIKTIRAKGKELESNKQFLDGDDWLSGLEMELANASGKTITFFQVELFSPAPEGNNRQPGIVWYLRYGDNPFHYESDKAMPPRSAKAIQPGEFVRFAMNETERNEMNRFSKAVLGSLPNRVETSITLLGFNDGTAWSGQMARRNGTGGWLPLNSSKDKVARSKQDQAAQRRRPKLSHSTAQIQDGCGFVFPSLVPCSPQPEGCKFERMNLFDELVGNESIAPTVAPCQITVNNFTLTCTFEVSFRKINCPIPCGQQFDTCLMDSDCCSGFCNGGQCGPPCPPNCGVCIDGLCYDESPVVIDVLGDGFALTNLENGVDFDLNADGTSEHLSWTTAGSDDAWLALDRNGNGTIDNGRELFGNFTPQADSPEGFDKNGFAALAEFDKIENGGNGDRYVTNSDPIFSALRLWQDTNHNGVSEPSELHALKDLGLKSIDLTYKPSKRTDEYGNRFGYRAKVADARNAQLGRWAWDVFLLARR